MPPLDLPSPDAAQATPNRYSVLPSTSEQQRSSGSRAGAPNQEVQ